MSHYCEPELNLRMRAARGVSAENVTQLCQLLRGHGWMTAREIRGLRPEWDERIIRRLASASGFRIISYPGSPGYRLAEDMTQAEIEEMEHAGAAMISQARDMMHRGIRFKRLAAVRRLSNHLLTP